MHETSLKGAGGHIYRLTDISAVKLYYCKVIRQQRKLRNLRYSFTAWQYSNWIWEVTDIVNQKNLGGKSEFYSNIWAYGWSNMVKIMFNTSKYHRIYCLRKSRRRKKTPLLDFKGLRIWQCCVENADILYQEQMSSYITVTLELVTWPYNFKLGTKMYTFFFFYNH